MFPNNPIVALSVRETPVETRQTLSQLIKPGETAAARIVSVTPNAAQTTQHKIQLEVEGKLIQLLSNQKPPTGTQAQIGLTPDGKVTLQLSQAQAQAQAQSSSTRPASSTPSASTTPSTTPSTTASSGRPASTPQIPMQIPTGQTLPLKSDQPIKAMVISSTPLTSPPPPQVQTTPQTYNRPIAPQASLTPQQAVSPPSVPTATSSSQTTPTQPSPASSQPTVQVPSAPSNTPYPAKPNAPQSLPVMTQNIPGTTSGTSKPAPPSSQVPGQGAPTPPATSGNQATAQQTPSAPSGVTISSPTSPDANKTSQSHHPLLQRGQAPTSQQPASDVSNVASAKTTPSNQESTARYVVQMQVAGQKPVQLLSPTPVPARTPVVLTQSHTGQVTASITSGTADQINTQHRELSTVQDALRSALPAQQPVAESLSQLQSISQQSSAQVSTLVRSMLTLFGVRPGADNSARQIQTNVESGGVQTEARLMQGKVDGKQDMKGLIRQLQQQVSDAPPEMRPRMEQLIQSVQSRITHNQLQSLAQSKETPDGGFERVLQIDLPIIHNQRMQNVELRISEEGHQTGEHTTTTRWRVRLHFNLESLGEIDAEIQLTAEEQLNIRFWCSEQETQRQIKHQLDTFEVQLNQKGFNPSELVCYLGQAPNPDADAVQKNLVDIHT